MPQIRTGLPVFHFLCPEKVRYTHHVQKAPAIRPANWIATALLFGVPALALALALAFAFLFHWLGPNLRQEGTSWWRIFHLLLILPLTCMFVAALIGAAFDRSFADLLGVDHERVRLWTFARAAAGPRDDWSNGDLVALARAIAP
jgi:hypothetical protein